MKNNEQQNEALKQLTNVLTEAGNQTRVDVLAHSILLRAIFSVLSEEQKNQIIKILQTATVNQHAATAGVEAEVKMSLAQLLSGFLTPQKLN
ncbi:hypothetical protein DR28_08460 [Salmonella enterica subsp. enterica serovar Muenchen]|nr:hypothetical protein [Salmonella enterica subsp. enterica serovar Muenchen]